MAEIADLNAEDIKLFSSTAGAYEEEAEQLGHAAGVLSAPTAVTAGEFIPRQGLMTKLNNAYQTGGRVLGQAAQGVNAYGGATREVGNEYWNAHDVSVEVLGSVLNAYGRTAQATHPGGQ